jgi:hypothetical protein
MADALEKVGFYQAFERQAGKGEVPGQGEGRKP